jgi:lactate dehydrogenase-like 2-hydroxyacid dehydrogenase
MSAGYDHIDVKELKARGIKFGNTPNVLNAAVAEVAVLLCLAAARRLHEGRLKIET